MFLGWYDGDKKKSTEQKLRDAIACHQQKWNMLPLVALVSSDDLQQVMGLADQIEIRAVPHVSRNTFLVGFDTV